MRLVMAATAPWVAALLVGVTACGRIGFEPWEADVETEADTNSDGLDTDSPEQPSPAHDTCEDLALVTLSSESPGATVRLETTGAHSDYGLACCDGRPELLVRVEFPSPLLLVACSGTAGIDVVVLDGCPPSGGDCVQLECGQGRAVLQRPGTTQALTTVTLAVCPASADAVFDLLLTAEWGS